MNILTINNVTMSFSEKELFKNISLTINEGDKIGLLGQNGCGKSTLLKIIAKKLEPLSGEVFHVKDKRIAYLSQNPEYHGELSVLDQIFQADTKQMNTIKEYESTVDALNKQPNDLELQEKFLNLTEVMDRLEAWEAEAQVKTVLTKLGIHNFSMKMKNLSGGQRKRVFLAQALLSDADLLILDEPTNHMDNEVIAWLEEYLKQSQVALLLVTHDRYFLDRVINQIVELSFKNLEFYQGNYQKYLVEKSAREKQHKKLKEKQKRLYQSELKWIRAGVQGRGTKQKARIDRFHDLKNKVHEKQDNDNFMIDVAFRRLGKKVIHINDLSKSYGELNLIKNFSTLIGQNERIGIIGKNGIGKSTLVKMILGKESIDDGQIDVGKTVTFGYFEQGFEGLPNDMKALEFIKSIAEYVINKSGHKISASQMMENFLFNKSLQWTYIKKLSGGEKRRLFLLKTLMLSPNVLILDEPTNDLDIETLNILENYLNAFEGTVITISHDRYFLDKTCEKILAFENDGKILEFVGNYSDYMAYRKKKVLNTSKEDTINQSKGKKSKSAAVKKKSNKLTYHEKKELETIESEIENLETRLDEIIDDISKQTSDFVKLQSLSTEKEQVEDELLYKMERFEYLIEKDEKNKER